MMVSFPRFLAAILLPMAAAARSLSEPPESPILDSIHAYTAKGELRIADSLVRSHAPAILASRTLDNFAAPALFFITGALDSVLSRAAGDWRVAHPRSRAAADLGLLLGYRKEDVDRRIDSAFGNNEPAAVLKVLLRAMIVFAAEKREDAPFSPDWYYTWKISPARRSSNAAVLEHLKRYGATPYGRILAENHYFLVEKHKVPWGPNILEGGGWMDGRDAGPIWWRSTSYLFEWRFRKGFAYLKDGRAVGGLGLAHNLVDTERFALSPFAGISRYPMVALGEYRNTRRYIGPDLGLNIDWKFKVWRPLRSIHSLYLRTHTGVVLDPERLSADFHRTSFVYLNLGMGIHLDAFVQYFPYVRNGKVKLKREYNWH